MYHGIHACVCYQLLEVIQLKAPWGGNTASPFFALSLSRPRRPTILIKFCIVFINLGRIWGSQRAQNDQKATPEHAQFLRPKKGPKYQGSRGSSGAHPGAQNGAQGPHKTCQKGSRRRVPLQSDQGAALGAVWANKRSLFGSKTEQDTDGGRGSRCSKKHVKTCVKSTNPAAQGNAFPSNVEQNTVLKPARK